MEKVKNVKPLKDTVLVSNMEFSERVTSAGIILVNDDMKLTGIRPRWAKVYAIGPDQKDVKVGQFILISHGRWTRGITLETESGKVVLRKVDNNDILMVSDEPVFDETLSDKEI